MPAFHERRYRLHVILGNPKSEPLWKRQSWQAIEPALLAVLGLIPGPKSMHSDQYDNAGLVQRGRIGLNAKGLEKWIHDDANYPDRNDWAFHSNEIWAPGRTMCGKLNLPPDLYFGFRNEGIYREPQNLTFNPFIILAGALDKSAAFEQLVDELVKKLMSVTDAVYSYNKETAWGKGQGSGGFSKAIGDLLTTGIFEGATTHSDSPFPERIEPYWQV